jgi:LCP family protein required for cell wall assembly
MAKVNKKEQVKIVPFFKYLAFILIFITIITLGLFKFIDVLPGEYFFILCVLLGIVTLGLSLLILTKRGPKKRAIGTFLSLIYLVFLILVIVYELNTIGFLKKLGFKNYKTENYSILVLNDSKYEKIEDLEKKNIGSLEFNNDGLKESKEKVEKKISVNFKTYNDISELKKDFEKNKVEAILIENSILAILTEDDGEFASSYKVIYDFSVDVETKDIAKKVDITKDTFSIYVSGIDTYGAVSSVSRSDVNMVITVNPKTNKILITSIPRDYYVPLAGKDGKDKLTHAGIYGVETSVKTIENLLDTKINYYIKVNFTSLIKVVDALGGVKVYSKYNFTSMDGYTYKEGYNNVNGEKALSFVRERKAFNGGDRVRVENQAAMIKALVEKATSPSIITKYNSLLKTLEKLFVTNLNMEDITEFIKKQIDDMKSWEVESQSLDGKDDYQYTYSYKGQKLYVMTPDNETVINAHNKIEEMFN